MDPKNNELFLELYRPSHDRLGRFVATLVWNREEASDTVSETILIALENFDNLRNREAFVHFLFGIAIRVIRKRQRKDWRSLILNEEGWESMENIARTEYRSDSSDLNVLLSLLGEKQREALTLFEISGFSIKEISEIQQSTVSAVKSRLVRARNTLEEACRTENERLMAYPFKS